MEILKKGDKILYNGRNAVVEKIKGNKVKVRPHGESSRWAKRSELKSTAT